jgi:hypothetical protein
MPRHGRYGIMSRMAARSRLKRPPKYALMQRIALALPGVREEGHRNGPWFNIGKRPFALYWGKSASWMLRLPPEHVMMLVTVGADIFRPMRNGSPFWVYIDVEKMDAAMLRDYVTAAWRHSAPKKMQNDDRQDDEIGAFA